MAEATFPTNEVVISESSTETGGTFDDQDLLDEFGEEFEEELIIEDFTIDGICGVY